MGYVEKLMVDLRMLGVREGDVLLVHSSLKGLNAPGIAPADAEEALERLLTPSGTLLMPTLSYKTVTREAPAFHWEKTPSCVGALTEWFRTHSAQHRSIHPTHSVAAWGKLAYAVTAWHTLDQTPVGPHSPFMQLPKLEGKILMLGCGLTPNTFMHGLEELCRVPYALSTRPTTYVISDSHGKTYKKQYIPHDFSAVTQRYDRVADVLPDGAYSTGNVMGGKAWLLDASALQEYASAQMRDDSYFFVDRAPAKGH